MQIPLFQILVIALVLLVLFGRRRIRETVGDIGKGVKTFREGLADDELRRVAADAGLSEPAADTDKSAG